MYVLWASTLDQELSSTIKRMSHLRTGVTCSAQRHAAQILQQEWSTSLANHELSRSWYGLSCHTQLAVIAVATHQQMVHGQHLFVPGLQYPVHHILRLVSYVPMLIGVVVHRHQGPHLLRINSCYQLILRELCCLQAMPPSVPA